MRKHGHLCGLRKVKVRIQKRRILKVVSARYPETLAVEQKVFGPRKDSEVSVALPELREYWERSGVASGMLDK